MARHRCSVCAPFAGDSTVAVHPGKQQDRTGTRAIGPGSGGRGGRVARGRVRASGRGAVWSLVRRRRCGWGSAATAMRWKSGCPIPFSANGSRVTTPPACSRRPRRSSAGRCSYRFEIHDEVEPPLGDVVEPAPARPEPDSEPQRRSSVTIPLPGNPKAPLSFPAPSPSVPGLPPPGPIPLPSTDRPQPPKRMQATSPAGTPSSAGSSSRPARRLEDFVTGPGNRLAHAAAREMAQSAGAAFNPLVIHSAVGLGKTHLLEGIGHALQAVAPEPERRSSSPPRRSPTASWMRCEPAA